MTIKVGQAYPIDWAGKLNTALVVGINLKESGKSEIHYKVVGRWPRWLWWTDFPFQTQDTAETFVNLMDWAEKHKRDPGRWVDEVEIKYR